MKKRYKILLSILLPLVILYVSTMLLTRDSDFTKEVTERLDIEQINAIDIIRASDEKTIIITDRAEIDQIMEQFKDQPLRKVYFGQSDFNEAYWITLHINDSHAVGLRLDDKNHLFVYLYEENYMKDYKILGDFNRSFIEDVFKK
ncbi:hypothetical protein ACIQXF_07430 [Lysinibacillus sp. NPDC097231]|uniref:hypothetical protein n=1 Tax=Lysinibacillus sp. NPDC097231 TaxID=3364142 RepID=UPI003803CB76